MESRFFGSYLTNILIGAAAAALFGCAPNTGTGTGTGTNRMAAMQAAGSTSGSTGFGGAGGPGWNCPESPNVTLVDNIGENGGYDYSGDGDYVVCTPTSSASGSATSFQITGTSTDQAICVYPLNEGSSGIPVLVATPQCFNVTGSPITANFSNPSAEINYFAIVGSNYTNAMNACLSSAAACPSHSEGFVQ